jgi:hypothetical protein
MSRESEFYQANVAAEINRRLVFHAALAVRVTQVESRGFPDLELDAVPPLRRLNFQSALLFGTYPGGATVLREAHSGGAHVSVISGAVTITSLTRSVMPRSFKRLQRYQETLAAEGQGVLFPEQYPLLADKLWGLFVYGGDYRSPRLTLCKMVFPTPKGNLAPGTIDLLADHSDVAARFDDREYAEQQIVEFLETRRLRRS